MKKSTLLSIALICLSTTSYATQPTGDGTVCNGSGSCGSTTTNNTTNQGGVGYGGAGGSATSVSTGGSATGGNSTAYGGASNVDVRNSSSNINANTVKNESSNVQGQIQGQGQKQSTNNANNSTNSVTVQGDNFESARNPVNTAYAPTVAATANCALGVSGGVSFVGFSGSFGKAYVDENCAMLEKVRAVSQVLGDKATAEALLCLDPKYAKARLNAGRACPVEQE